MNRSSWIMRLGLATLLLGASCAGQSDAALLVYESFSTTVGGADASYNANATIRNANEPRLGFTGSWSSAGTFSTAIDYVTRPSGLSGVGTITTPGGLEFYRSSGASTEAKSIFRSFDYAFSSDELWSSFLFSVDGFTSGNRMDVMLDGVGNRDLTFRFTPGSDGGAILNVLGGGNIGSTINLGAVEAGETYLLVFRASDRPGGDGFNGFYDDLSIWLNPENLLDLGDPDGVGYSVVRNQGPNEGDVFGFNRLFLDGVDVPAGFSFMFDEFRLGTSMMDVVSVPEPSAWALGASGALGLVWLARRRRCSRVA